MTSISGRAFCGCTSLTELTLSENLRYLGSEMFDNCPDLVLTVKEGSHAEKYCKENELKYVVNGKVPGTA